MPGTLVTLGSFLKHHPGFDGDLVVVHDELPQRHQTHLAAISSAVRFEQVSAKLRVRLAALSAECPNLAGRLGRQTLVSSTYDFVLERAALIKAREGANAEDAKALHFTGAIKPWMPDAMLRWTRGDAEHRPRDFFKLWYNAYLGCLADVHLRSVKRRLVASA